MTTTWTRIVVVCGLAIAFACDPDDDDGAGDDPDQGGAAQGDDDDNGALECGLVDPSLSDCDACAAKSCCTQAEACAADAECSECYATADKPLECWQNAALQAFSDCINGPCAPVCSPSSGDGGDGSSGSCSTTTCNDGPGGNATCQAAGCGDCSFGYCLVF